MYLTTHHSIMNANMRARPERRGYEKILYRQHIERISAMKPTIDNSTPHPLPLSNRCERERAWKNKLIDYDNKLLLERIATAIQQPAIDNKLDEHVETQSKFKRRLYRIVRQSKLQQITLENHNLLKRIQMVPPVYNAQQMEQEYKRSQEVMKRMCIY